MAIYRRQGSQLPPRIMRLCGLLFLVGDLSSTAREVGTEGRREGGKGELCGEVWFLVQVDTPNGSRAAIVNERCHLRARRVGRAAWAFHHLLHHCQPHHLLQPRSPGVWGEIACQGHAPSHRPQWRG